MTKLFMALGCFLFREKNELHEVNIEINSY